MHFKLLCAEGPDLTTRQTIRAPGGREYGLSLFSDAFLQSKIPNARAELRSKSRAVLLVSALLRDLAISMEQNTGIYMYCGHGPVHRRTQEVAFQTPPPERALAMERTLPPKDYFISNPAIKAAQLSIDFGLHGPWMVFLTSQGLAQACRYGRIDLEDGQVDGALVVGAFMLDEPLELCNYSKSFEASGELAECVFVHYATRPEDVLWPGEAEGRYGPLTSLMEHWGK